MKAILAVLLVIGVATLAPACRAGQPVTVDVLHRDGASGALKPVPGATVRLETIDGKVVDEATADDKGQANLGTVRPGVYVIRTKLYPDETNSPVGERVVYLRPDGPHGLTMIGRTPVDSNVLRPTDLESPALVDKAAAAAEAGDAATYRETMDKIEDAEHQWRIYRHDLQTAIDQYAKDQGIAVEGKTLADKIDKAQLQANKIWHKTKPTAATGG
jgi:hypothetical protein